MKQHQQDFVDQFHTRFQGWRVRGWTNTALGRAVIFDNDANDFVLTIVIPDFFADHTISEPIWVEVGSNLHRIQNEHKPGMLLFFSPINGGIS